MPPALRVDGAGSRKEDVEYRRDTLRLCGSTCVVHSASKEGCSTAAQQVAAGSQPCTLRLEPRLARWRQSAHPAAAPAGPPPVRPHRPAAPPAPPSSAARRADRVRSGHRLGHGARRRVRSSWPRLLKQPERNWREACGRTQDERGHLRSHDGQRRHAAVRNGRLRYPPRAICSAREREAKCKLGRGSARLWPCPPSHMHRDTADPEAAQLAAR